jgi:hypothetical protein
VFSPCRAEQSQTEPNRAVKESLIASHCLASLLPGNSYKHLDDARIRKGHVSALVATQQFKRFPACQIQGFIGVRSTCGGGVEYLHRDPASCRRRRKRKSQNWDSKICSRDPRASDPRKTTLARTSSINKRQTRPLVREGAPQKQDRNCQRVTNIWSWAPDGARHQDLLVDGRSTPRLTGWLTVNRNVTLTLTSRQFSF